MLMPISGVMTATAPVAMPDFKAMNPLSRPITSTKNRRLWLSAVSLILSTDVHHSVDGGVKSNGGVRAAQIVVNGSREADHREACFLPKLHRPRERAVASNHDQSIHPSLDQVHMCTLASFSFVEFGAARGLENGAAPPKDLGHRTNVQTFEVTVNQALVPLKHADHLQIVEHRSTNHSSNGCIHARCVTP